MPPVVSVESLQILRGCIIVEGVLTASSGPVGLGLSLDGLRLPASVDWNPGRRRRWLRSLVGQIQRAPGRPWSGRFLLRALADPAFGSEVLPRLVLTARAGFARTVLSNLLGPWVASTLAPGVDALYGRFQRDVASRPGARILELGARARSGHERRGHFASAEHVGFDIREGPGVDVVGDAHALRSIFPDGHFAFATSVSVFEHLAWPWKAVVELAHVLEPGGLVYTQSHQTWPVHDAPWDFYRYSKSGWRALFCAATGFEVVAADDLMPARVVPLCQTGDPSIAVEGSTGFLMSACIARKIGEPQVAWDAVPDLSLFAEYPA